MEEALIQYKNVEIHQQELCVLSGVNLELHKGEFVYLIGKVGSGKTSLLKTLYGELDVMTVKRKCWVITCVLSNVSISRNCVGN